MRHLATQQVRMHTLFCCVRRRKSLNSKIALRWSSSIWWVFLREGGSELRVKRRSLCIALVKEKGLRLFFLPNAHKLLLQQNVKDCEVDNTTHFSKCCALYGEKMTTDSVSLLKPGSITPPVVINLLKFDCNRPCFKTSSSVLSLSLLWPEKCLFLFFALVWNIVLHFRHFARCVFCTSGFGIRLKITW